MMKFWEYLSSTFDDVWASRCSWFVRTDDDTWMNTRLLERRLRCINPDKELSVGFTNKVLETEKTEKSKKFQGNRPALLFSIDWSV
eukprot:1003852-Amorphochlora_amoeboformis.AAC.1